MKKYILLLLTFLAFSFSIKAANFVVTTTNDSGLGSLRQAILDANASAGMDNIDFNITGTAPFTIVLLSDLPFITDEIIIDGSTQIDFAGFPVIEIDYSGDIFHLQSAHNSGIYNIAFINTSASMAGKAIVSTASNNIMIAFNIFDFKQQAIQINTANSIGVFSNNLNNTGASNLAALSFDAITGMVNISNNKFTGDYFDAYNFSTSSNLIVSNGSVGGTNVTINEGSGTNLAQGTVIKFSLVSDSQISELDLSYINPTRTGQAVDVNGTTIILSGLQIKNRISGGRVNGSGISVSCSYFENNTTGLFIDAVGTILTTNIFQKNAVAINASVAVNATNQFWGRNTGSISAGGKGDSYIGTVTAIPFLTCPDACISTYQSAAMDLEGNSIPIANGSALPNSADETDFGTLNVGNTQSFTYTIYNTDNGLLEFPNITITGIDAANFSIVTLPTPLDGSGSTTLQISFTPLSAGTKNATIVIESTDCNNDPYTFAIRGIGVSTCTDSTIPTISGDTDICIGETTTLSIATGNLNDATNWFWYTASCGGTLVGNGTSINVSPTTTTSYFIRGEGGCVTLGACQTVSVNVNPLPVLTFNPLANVCINSGIVNLIATPAGGTFTGTNVTGTTFNPITAGTFTLTYTYSDANSCSNSITQNITVLPSIIIPTVTFNPLADVCIASGIVNLIANPVGGIFTGIGVNGTTFNPTSVGTFTITYTYSSFGGCGASTVTKTQTIKVKPVPVLEFNLIDNVCIDNGIVNLSATPIGGTFTGLGVLTGVNGASFDPLLAGTGTKTITYSYTQNGCTKTISKNIEVFDLPVLTFENPTDICIDNGIIDLIASPNGGTFRGIGVNGTTFNPSLAGIGIFEITYIFINQNGCQDSVSQDIEVFDLPVLTFENPTDICVDNGIINLIASPNGGTFTGSGVTTEVNGTTFNPSLAGTGFFEITYTFTNQNGCTNSITQNIEVFDLPLLTFQNPTDICIDNGIIDLIASPNGGIFTGIGVNGTTFNPLLAGTGIFEITYTFTNQNGCTNSITQNIEVFDLPTLTISSNSPICADTTLQLTAISSSDIIEWNWRGANGFTSNLQNPIIQNASVANEGQYILTITNQNGCQISDTLNVDILEGEVLNSNFLISNEGCVNDTIHFVDITVLEGENIAFSWDFGDGTTSTERYPTHIYQSEGVYTISINVSSGECFNQSVSKQIAITDCNTGRFEPIQNTPITSFISYPNPSNTGEVKMEINSLDTNPIKIEIVNVLGRIVNEFTLQGDQNYKPTINIPISGTYIIYVKTSNGVFSRKIVIAL